MASLTSCLSLIVNHLDMTRAALYERQRALVRLGLLPKPQGRGRGSGAEATPQTVALLLISALITDNLSDMDVRVIELAHKPITEWRKRKCCRLTGASHFVGALAAVLGDHSLARRVSSITVHRQSRTATIFWTQKISKNVGLSNFGDSREGGRSFEVEATIRTTALAQIAAVLAAEAT